MEEKILIATAKAICASDFQFKNELAQLLESIGLNSWASSFLSWKSPAQTAFAVKETHKVRYNDSRR